MLYPIARRTSQGFAPACRWAGAASLAASRRTRWSQRRLSAGTAEDEGPDGQLTAKRRQPRRKCGRRRNRSSRTCGRRFRAAPRRSKIWRSNFYARGLSTRDIEDAFTDQRGRRLLSRAAVSEITERLWAPYHWLDFTPARSQIAPLQRPTLSAPRTEGRMRVHRTRWVIQPPQNRLEKKSVGRSKPD